MGANEKHAAAYHPTPLSDDDLITIAQKAKEVAQLEGLDQARQQDRAAVAIFRALFNEAKEQVMNNNIDPKGEKAAER